MVLLGRPRLADASRGKSSIQRHELASGNFDTTLITATSWSYSLDTSVDQTGVTYEFVGRVSWPSGSTNKIYATCSM
jgi:hypothetical protein